jgi:hypothetical protein
MGASSSSAYWEKPYEYDHKSKELNAYYETTIDDIRFVQDVKFSVKDCLEIAENKNNLFPDITLVLDIDFTLGQASMFHYNPVSGFLMDEKTPIDIHHLKRLKNYGRGEWFHNGTCFFFIRPYFHDFITFCIRNFEEVIIWTNGVQKHADDMVNLICSLTGKTLRGFGRTYSTSDKKIVSTIGLDPSKTWMVDDDHRHYYKNNEKVELEVNSQIKFFHTPEFSVSWFENVQDLISKWLHEKDMIELYDDWFLFLIWNWNYMKENKIEMQSFCRKENKFIH